MTSLISFFKGLYQKWMAFAEKLGKFVQTILFGVVYFFFLPFLTFFVPKDRLGLKAYKSNRTLWLKRSQPTDTLENLQRMG